MNKPFIIAEISGNHNGDISKAIKLIQMAKDAGADAVKLQTYTADTITINCDKDDFIVKGGLWNGYKLYDLYRVAHTPWEWHKVLFAKGKELGITIFSTPFDETAVDLLESLESPLYKIASFELNHHPLIAYVAKTKKPIIMSTGMASLDEIKAAVEVAVTNGCTDLTLLHCVSEYPAPIKNSNLCMLSDLKSNFPECKIGLSDHTMGVTVSIAAVALGAEVIEKHVILSRSEGGVDSAFSLEPEELRVLCEEAKNAFLAIGTVNYKRSENERKNITFRRSLYITKDIKRGELFTHANVKVIRPGYGVSPALLPKIIGKKAAADYVFGTAVEEGFIENE